MKSIWFYLNHKEGWVFGFGASFMVQNKVYESKCVYSAINQIGMGWISNLASKNIDLVDLHIKKPKQVSIIQYY